MDSELRSKLHSGVPTKNRKHKPMIIENIATPPDFAPNENGMHVYWAHQRRKKANQIHAGMSSVLGSLARIEAGMARMEETLKAIRVALFGEAR